MATTTITIRTDESVKQQAFEILSDLGLDMSGAVNAFLRAVIRSKSIPFAIAADPFDDPVIRARVEKELARRVELADDPNTRWYSTEEVKEMLGI